MNMLNPMESTPEFIAGRMRALRKRTGHSMAEMAKALGFKGASSYQRYENPAEIKGGHLPRDFVDKIAKAIVGKGNPKITIDEVWELAGPEFTGRDLVYDSADPAAPEPIDPDAQAAWLGDEGPQGVPVDASAQIDVTAGMGGGGVTIVAEGVPGRAGMTFSADVIRDYWRIPPALLGMLGLRAQDVAIIPVQGNSMLPTLDEGDFVFVDTRHRWPSPDGLYALGDEFGGIVVKRLEVVSQPGEEKIVRVISDNTMHAPKEWRLEDLRIIGRVMRKFSTV